jgi:hypothetical protein
MVPSPETPPGRVLEGRLLRTDVPGRELVVLVGGVPVAVDVPPACEIRLHGENIRLRLLQPDDSLSLSVRETPVGWSADSIRVNEVVERREKAV